MFQTHAHFETLQLRNIVMTLLSHTHTKSEISLGTTSIIEFITCTNMLILTLISCIKGIIGVSATHSSHCPSVFFLYSSVSKATALASRATGDGH